MSAMLDRIAALQVVAGCRLWAVRVDRHVWAESRSSLRKRTGSLSSTKA